MHVLDLNRCRLDLGGGRTRWWLDSRPSLMPFLGKAVSNRAFDTTYVLRFSPTACHTSKGPPEKTRPLQS